MVHPPALVLVVPGLLLLWARGAVLATSVVVVESRVTTGHGYPVAIFGSNTHTTIDVASTTPQAYSRGTARTKTRAWGMAERAIPQESTFFI